MLSGSMSIKASMATCRNGPAVIVRNARAVEVFPTLPTPLRMMTCGRGTMRSTTSPGWVGHDMPESQTRGCGLSPAADLAKRRRACD